MRRSPVFPRGRVILVCSVMRFERSSDGIRVLFYEAETFRAIRADQMILDLDPADLIIGAEVISLIHWALAGAVRLTPPPELQFFSGRRVTYDPVGECLYAEFVPDRSLHRPLR